MTRVFRPAMRPALCALVTVIAAAALVSPDAGAARRPRARALAATEGSARHGVATGALLFGAPDDVFNADLDAIAGFGARWIRTPLRWSNVEAKGKGIYNWRMADRLVQGARSRGLDLVLTIVGTPKWAQPAGSGGDASYPPANLADYADFAGAAAARYRDHVRVWELGNEPNHATGWMPKPDPARYAQLMALTYRAIKASDPGAVVLTGGLGGEKSDSTRIPGDVFVANLYELGAGASFDGVSFHPYTYPYSPPARSWNRMLNVRQIMVKNGDGAKKIWATEFGAPTNGPRPRVVVSERRQAELLREAYDLFSSYRWAGALMWFQHRDNGNDPRVQDDWFGLLRANRTEKPAVAAYRASVAAAGG